MSCEDIHITIAEENPINIKIAEEDPINVRITEGKDGQPLNPRGAWSSTVTYSYLDLVTYDGSSYVAKGAVPAGTAVTNTTYWQLNAAKGEGGASSWDDITGKPETFPPSEHTHDDRYYTEQETDALLLDKAPVILSSASGSIASFPDGSPAPVTALSVSIEPVQDLHGYDHPWPAGGGKNLIPLTVEKIKSVNTVGTWSGNDYTYQGVTYKILTDNGNNVVGINVNGTSPGGGGSGSFLKLPIDELHAYDGESLKVSIGLTTAVNYLRLWIGTETYGQITATNSGNGSTFTMNSTAVRFWLQVTAGGTVSNTTVYPMVRLVSVTDATFAPYSNICPISGHTSAVVTRTGKNLFTTAGSLSPAYIRSDGVVVNGAASASGWNVSDYILVKGGTTYHFTPNSTSGDTAKACCFDKDKNYISSYFDSGEITFTTPSNCAFMRFSYRDVSTDIQLELGSSASSFEPYQPIQTVTINLGETRYGATLNVMTGLMTMTDGYIASYNGETLPSTWISDRDAYAEGTIPTIGAQVVYKLASPQTVQLSPSKIQTLLGTNNIWADTGDVAVTYRADTKLFIEKLTKPTEDDMIANANIASGKYFMVGNSLYLSSQSIAQGDAIVPGTNCTPTSLAEALNAINA